MKNNLLSEKLIYTGESDTPTHFHLCSYGAKEFNEFSGNSFQELSSKIIPGCINWIQVHGLRNTETIREVCSYFQINFLTIQDILNVNHPSKIEERETYNVLISKISEISSDSDDSNDEEIHQNHVCIMQGNDYVLTFMEEDCPFFDDVISAIRSNILKIRERDSDFLFSVLFNSLVVNYISVVSHIDDALEDLESALFENKNGHDIGVQIQILRKQYLLMKQTVFPLKEQYSKVLRSESTLFHAGNRAFFSDVNDHLLYAIQTIENCRETLASLMELYISNNDLRMNDIMTRLTIVSTIFIPLTFLVGVWGMNFKWMPELDWRYGYLSAWILMIVIGICVYIYLKKKKW